VRSDDLNYHHLHYFWVVAREGSLTRACKRLGVAPSTVSAQLKELEGHFGQALFDRSGRRLTLTEQGELALEYADQIFNLGNELDDVMIGGRTGRPTRLRVGVSDLVPKLVVFRLLEPALRLDESVQLHVYGDRVSRLVADLALHHLDLVLSSEPVAAMAGRAGRSRVLGASGLSVFGTADLVERHGQDLPDSLDGAPFLLPTTRTRARRDLDEWFVANKIVPSVVAELADSGLLKAFGSGGQGLFVAPSAVADDICRTYDVRVLTELPGLRERYYALAPHRDPEHPAVAAVIDGVHKGFISEE